MRHSAGRSPSHRSFGQERSELGGRGGEQRAALNAAQREERELWVVVSPHLDVARAGRVISTRKQTLHQELTSQEPG
jgi:hypothetical protein